MSSSSEDESLDPKSSKFDPLKALYARNLRLTVPEAPIYDNVSKYCSAKLPPKKEPSRPVQQGPQPSTSRESERRFLPHQMPILRPRVPMQRNVLTRMESVRGPLALLQECVESEIRIKVFTRKMNGIRGYCEAFVVAFDRHWNLALRDVREIWTRKKKVKIPPVDPRGVMVDSTPAAGRSVVVLQSNRKEEVVERYISQLLMRGEHVALISVLR